MPQSPDRLVPGPRYRQNLPDVRGAYFDVDNTLVANESPDLPTDRFTTAARKANRLIRIALATARQAQKVEHILSHIEARGISILMNGAQLFDGSNGEMKVERPLRLKLQWK